jgi:hypothetical protein
MPTVAGIGVGLRALLGVFRLVLGRPLPRFGAFRRRSGRTLAASHAGSLFAVVGLVQLVFDWSSKFTTAGVRPSVLVGLLVALLVVGSLGAGFASVQAPLTVVGIGAGVADTWISYGPPAAVFLLVVVVLMLWVSGLVRIFVPR